MNDDGDDLPRREISRSTSVSEVFEWLKRRISSHGQRERVIHSQLRHHGILPIEIESSFTEHARDGRELSDLFPLSRVCVQDPRKSGGLMEDEATSRYKLDGPNLIRPQSGSSGSTRYLSQYLQSFRLLLLITAVICVIIFFLDVSHRLLELAIALFIVVVLIVMSSINYYQDNWTRKFSNAFQSMVAPSCSVVRNGKSQTMSAESLVVGDIVNLRCGMRVPADIRLLATDALRIETSWITGDMQPLPFVATPTSSEIPAMQAQNIAFAGSSVSSGSGIGIVIRTGCNTVLGRLSSLSSSEKGRRSRLIEDKIHFVRFIVILSLAIGISTFLIGIAISRLTNVVHILINGLFIVIVANIPQGLPVMLTTQLLIVSRRLARRGVFLKRPDTADTLGRTTVLLVEKTGVLTENSATLTDIWMDGEKKTRNPHNFHPESFIGRLPVDSYDEPMDRILMTMILCNRARVESSNPVERFRQTSMNGRNGRANGKIDYETNISLESLNLISGPPLDSALMKFADELCDIADLRKQYEIVFEIPFNKQRRWHLVIARAWHYVNEHPDTIIRYKLFVKGAPEELITKCFNIATKNGDRTMGERDLEKFKSDYLFFGNRGRSCIGFATVEFEEKAGKMFDINNADYPEDGLTFLGMAAIVDSPREEIGRAVERAKSAKIKLHVVTGDHPSTAAAVAKEAKLIDENCTSALVLVGSMVDELTSHEWDVMLKRDHIVFARISPTQKRLVVEELMRRGEIVAVTGDGVLDAPSLKEAHIGVAIDAVGSAFAKEAADIVVNDGNLENILYGVEQGRLLFSNLRKAIAFTLTHLMAEILPVLLHFILGFPLGLTSIQVFATDLLCEIFPSISMIFEGPERDVMKKPPRKSSSRLVSRSLLIYSYLLAGSIIAVGCFAAYLAVYIHNGIYPSTLLYSTQYWTESSPSLNLTSGEVIHGLEQSLIRREACGAWQITLAGSQALHIWQCRTRRVSVFSHTVNNPWILIGSTISLALTVFFVYVPGVNTVMGTAAPPHFVWSFPLFVGLLLLFFNETRKLLIRRYAKNKIVRILKW
ncbi:hypothetical protein PRIPAC_89262 [Pristionchus pacificus]|nr:hypothetical protein PRIPAC_89262 [Pristionchus pacificus]